jgi:hypothetical protein
VALDHALRPRRDHLHIVCAGVGGEMKRNHAPKNAPSPSRPVHAVLGAAV